tara:strand:+ start:1014 stop:1799 length:786 start_codon:yes stop_codon:yes gene_type:complete
MSVNATWDGTSMATKGWTGHNINKDVLGNQKRFTLDPPDRDGVIEVRKKFPARTIRYEGRLTGTSYNNLVQSIIPAFSTFMYNDSDVQLIFADETDRYFNAQVQEMRATRMESLFRFYDIYFICSDPFSYDTTPDTDSQAGITVDETSYSINNGGHYFVYPTITITFNQIQTHIYIQNNTVTNNRFDISKSFEAADVLVIDCKAGTIKLNGSHSPAGFGDGGSTLAEWIVFAVGGNQVEVGTDDPSIDVDVDLSWNKVYLS